MRDRGGDEVKGGERGVEEEEPVVGEGKLTKIQRDEKDRGVVLVLGVRKTASDEQTLTDRKEGG